MTTVSKKLLIINYNFEDQKIDSGQIFKKLYNYYFNNSRGKLILNCSKQSIRVPFSHKQLKEAIKYVKSNLTSLNGGLPANYDYYVHICNPPTSHAGINGTHAFSYNSVTNVIHETGHLLGFYHANRYDKNGKTLGSRDPFDCMTITKPYPSLNPPHRSLKDWFLPGEEVQIKPGTTYTLAMMSDFADKQSIKTIFHDNGGRRYWFSYGLQKLTYNLICHTLIGGQSTFLTGTFDVDRASLLAAQLHKSRVWNHIDSGLQFTVIPNPTNRLLTVQVESSNSSFVEVKEPDLNNIQPQVCIDADFVA